MIGPLIAGFSDSLHDRAVCLFDGAEPLVAIEEERLTRVKHGLELRGERRDDPALFARLGLEADPPDMTRPGLDAMLAYCLDAAGVDRSAAVLACGNSLHDAYPWGDRALFVNHHLAHAASAFFSSGFSEAAIVVADGYGDRSGRGEFETVLIARGVGCQVKPVRAISGRSSSYFDMEHSLGVLYRLGTLLSGFALLDEGKAMGLSAYGHPTLRDRLDRFIEHTSTGVRIDNGGLWEAFEDLRVESLDFAARADVAASFEVCLEDALLHYVELTAAMIPSRNLCLAGGVALNCVANGRIAAEGPFDEVFVPPAPADNGVAFGAAGLLAHTVLGLPRQPRLRRTSWGASYATDTLDTTVHAGRLQPVPCNDLAAAVADALVAGEIVAVVRGGAEFGPRALGHRSFLANPGSTATRDFINAHVKYRELFRPLAPMVPEEDVSTWFEWAQASPFMLFTVPARDRLKTVAPAVVHHDGTARLQTVAASDDPFIHAVLRAFGDRTGCPVLLNTSLNGRGEPIVETPSQAISLLERSPVTHLVLEDRLLRKVPTEGWERARA